MNVRLRRVGLAMSSVAVLIAAGCGGGSDAPAAAPIAATPPPPNVVPAPPAAPLTTNVSTTVVDGAIKNAVVCIDKNSNGLCDTDEVKGTTDAAGNVTLAVPNADVGLYPILALIGTDAIDADHGAITVPYKLSAPADQVTVVSPLTTLVQQTIVNTGATTAEAAKSVADATGITTSLFADFTKATAPTDGTVDAATVARLVVVTTQKQSTTVAAAVGTTAIDGTVVTQADLDKAVQKKLLELLPSLITALTDPTVAAATTPDAKEAALAAVATTLVTNEGLSSASVATVVAVNNQSTVTTPVVTTPATATFAVTNLNFTNVSNYYARLFTSSAEQNTLDTNGKQKYVERRIRSNAGHVAKWASGSDPWRAADLHWNGSAWVGCAINFENSNTPRDAAGNSSYDYCDGLETGKSQRSTFDVSGKTMVEVYAQVRAGGYTNLTIADPTALGSSVFPTGSTVQYQTGTPLTNAFAYYAAGADNPVGTSNVVSEFSVAVSAGGDGTKQAAGVGCNSAETNTNGVNTTTLDGLIASKKGTACYFAQGSFVYNGATYTSDPSNEWWGQSTVSIGKIGTAPIGSGAAPGFYSGNTLIRVAFTGTNAVTYYACKERFNNGSARNCTPIGTGAYAIQTLGDAKVMTLTNPPVQAASLTYNRVFVERGGLVYFGYQSKPTVTAVSRLNTVAGGAVLTQLGVPAEDPSVPLALTASSYQGTWDFKDPSIIGNAGSTVFINGNGSVSCQDRSDSSFYVCALTVTNPATGAFTMTDDGNSTMTGTFGFALGTGSGTYTDPSSTPASGSFVISRR